LPRVRSHLPDRARTTKQQGTRYLPPVPPALRS
jgi:hypothetical protein